MTMVEPTDSASPRFAWRKSSRSQLSNCVEVGLPVHDTAAGVVAVRDSKDPHGPALLFSRRSWDDFLAATKNGEFDRG